VTPGAVGPVACSVLIANNIGDDLSGHNVYCWLERFGVTTTAAVEADAVTPQIRGLRRRPRLLGHRQGQAGPQQARAKSR
jgi:hypothetical protein